MDTGKQEIKAICGVSEVTINKCFKKLEVLKESLLPQVIRNKYNIIRIYITIIQKALQYN